MYATQFAAVVYPRYIRSYHNGKLTAQSGKIAIH